MRRLIFKFRYRYLKISTLDVSDDVDELLIFREFECLVLERISYKIVPTSDRLFSFRRLILCCFIGINMTWIFYFSCKQ